MHTSVLNFADEFKRVGIGERRISELLFRLHVSLIPIIHSLHEIKLAKLNHENRGIQNNAVKNRNSQFEAFRFDSLLRGFVSLQFFNYTTRLSPNNHHKFVFTLTWLLT